jgi:hypothetical protein
MATVFFDNEDVRGSPHVFNVFDPTQVKINSTLTSTNLVHKNISFNIDASNAGKGLVTAQIFLGSREFPVDVRQLNDNNLKANLYSFDFAPPQSGLYKCNIYFNNKPVKGMLHINIIHKKYFKKKIIREKKHHILFMVF